MPYTVKGKCVYNKNTRKKVGCTKGSIKNYLASLHANVPDSKMEETEKPMKKIKLSEIAKRAIKEARPAPLMLNDKEVDRGSIELDGVDPRDFPDFSDAVIDSAKYVDGTPLTDEEIEQLENENYGLAHSLAHGRYMEESHEPKYDPEHDDPIPVSHSPYRIEWEDDDRLWRQFEKSDVSWREFDERMNPQSYR